MRIRDGGAGAEAAGCRSDGAGRRSAASTVAALSLALTIALSQSALAGDGSEPGPIADLMYGCMAACTEKKPQILCEAYCECHKEKIVSGLTEEEVYVMLKKAEKDGRDGDQIRAFLIATAEACRRKILGD